MAKRNKYGEWLQPDNILRLSAWARDGLTDEQIAKNMGISRSTLGEWKNKYSVISDALKKSKEVADVEVENALHQRAVGYTYTETTRERATITDPETGEKKDGLVVTKEVTKEVAPDTTAQIYWLSNRKKDTWRRNPDNDDMTNTPIKIQLVGDVKDYAK